MILYVRTVGTVFSVQAGNELRLHTHTTPEQVVLRLGQMEQVVLCS